MITPSTLKSRRLLLCWATAMSSATTITAARRRQRHLVITVHGIRTFGDWQERLEKLLPGGEHGYEVRHYRYGYFSVLAFLVPFLRWLVTRHFRHELLREIRLHPGARVDLVAHSFGTHLVAWALLGIPRQERPRIHTIILAGSVLKVGFSGAS